MKILSKIYFRIVDFTFYAGKSVYGKFLHGDIVPARKYGRCKKYIGREKFLSLFINNKISFCRNAFIFYAEDSSSDTEYTPLLHFSYAQFSECCELNKSI